MKILVKALTILTVFLSLSTQACDESCKRAEAEETHRVSFPGYLSWNYCDGLVRDFFSYDMDSLKNYSSKHFDTQYKGPIKNIVNLIGQRKDWLGECDDYISKTRSERVFYDNKTTAAIFKKMDIVKNELNGVIKGVRYSSPSGDETKKIVSEKFEDLFQAVDDHKNLMHLKGKFVYQ
jgi:hypothetical protein